VKTMIGLKQRRQGAKPAGESPFVLLCDLADFAPLREILLAFPKPSGEAASSET